MFQRDQISTITAYGHPFKRRRLINEGRMPKTDPAPIRIRTLLEDSDEPGSLVISEDHPLVCIGFAHFGDRWDYRRRRPSKRSYG